MFAEGLARPLLLFHAVAAALLVATTTHHLFWCRGYFRGDFRRAAGERRFALYAALAYSLTLALGLILYPTYKVRVRAEYFDNPSAISAELTTRQSTRTALGFEPPRSDDTQRLGSGLAPVARAFDVKEHAVALGAFASLLLLLLSRRAHPSQDARFLPLYLGLSLFACLTAWAGALIGLAVNSYRSLGSVL